MSKTETGPAGPAAGLVRGLERFLDATPGFLDMLPIGVYVCDRDGTLIQFNRRAAELWGRTPKVGSERFCGTHKAYTIDGKPLDLAQSPMSEVLKTGQPAQNREFILERPDGSRITIVANVEPIFDDQGKVVGAIDCFQDITNLRAAEDAVRQSERGFRQLLEALPAAVYTTDAAGRITFFNQAAAELWGVRPALGSAEWCGSWKLYWPDGTPLAHGDCPMAMALKENRPMRGVEAVAERPDGTRVPFMPFPTLLRDEAGNLTGAVNMLVDISERKEADSRQKVLLDELNHRVKNTLATVQSLAAQTVRGTKVPRAVRDNFEARLVALSRAHDQLTRGRWESANLKEIAEEIFAPYRSKGGNGLVIDGEGVYLAPQASLMLAMIFHELATNAAKYGSLSAPTGQLALSWKVANGSGPRRLRIEWQESGGPQVTEPARRGFGSKLVERGITQELKGSAEMTFDPGGLRCTMEIPLGT
ncbi:MAG TPA: HWE histidine kinase domain-containing protein [Xanthobacteraceae bacterium]|nr:HWE histidine kinase domain-containing protein [Xanthobacteraceae bacterium]